MMRPLYFYLVTLGLFAACAPPQAPSDWQTYTDRAHPWRFEYRRFGSTLDSSTAVNYGDVLDLDLAVRAADGRLLVERLGMKMQVPVAMHRNLFEAPLVLLAEPGDSLWVRWPYRAAAVPDLAPFAQSLQEGDTVYLSYKLLQRQTRQSREAEQEAEYLRSRGYANRSAWEADRDSAKAKAQYWRDSLHGWQPIYHQGLQVQVLGEANKPLALEPKTGDTLYLHYILLTSDGQELDNSLRRGERLALVWGDPKLSLAKVWPLALPHWQKTGRLMLFIPPDLGYGAEGLPPLIPPKAWLKLYLEL